MPRGLTTAFADSLAGDTIRLFNAVSVQFSNNASERIRLWTGYGRITINGDEYVGMGNLGSISPIIESSELAAKGITFRLTGASSLIAAVFSQSYQGNPIDVYLGTMDNQNNIIGVKEVFGGFLNTMNVVNNGEVIEGTAENRFLTLQKANVRTYTTSDQAVAFPGDTGFDLVQNLTEKEIVWGS